MSHLSAYALSAVCALATVPMQGVEVQGHRGARGWYPENTIPAFIAGIKAGANLLELDLLVTSDGELVVYHDFFINPNLCAYMDGKAIPRSDLVYELPLSEIKRIDCGAIKNEKFPQQTLIPGTAIPTLKELFAAIEECSLPEAKKIRLNLEIKVDPARPQLTLNRHDFAIKVVNAVKESGFNERVIYSSFDRDVLADVRHLNPSAKIAFLLDEETLLEAWNVKPEEWLGFMLTTASALRADVVSPEHVLLDKAAVDLLHQSDFRVVTWTVNEAQDWKSLVEMGVDGIITDYPQQDL